MTPYSLQVSGWLFVGASLLLWLGWRLLPHRPGPFFLPDDFGAIRARYRTWIWLYRIHIFGFLLVVMAVAALGAAAVPADARALLWPGAAVMAAGAVVGALAAAFYYHVGAWGALELEGRSAGEHAEFIAAARVSSHYATCLTRFGRVFFGLGQVVLAAGLWHDGTLPTWIAGAGATLGLAAMGLTMARPDELHRYRPVFDLNAAWMLALGLLAARAALRAAG